MVNFQRFDLVNTFAYNFRNLIHEVHRRAQGEGEMMETVYPQFFLGGGNGLPPKCLGKTKTLIFLDLNCVKKS